MKIRHKPKKNNRNIFAHTLAKKSKYEYKVMHETVAAEKVVD